MIYDPLLHEIWSEPCAQLSRQFYEVDLAEQKAIDCKVVISNEENLSANCIILPDLCAHLIIHESTSPHTKFRYSLVGPRSRAIKIDHHNRSRTTAIRLRPDALSSGLNIPVGEVLDRSIHMSDLSPDHYQSLESLIKENCDAEHILNLMTGYTKNRSTDTSKIWEGLKNYCRTSTRLTVSETAAYIGTSERNLYKVCKTMTGMSAKSVLRIERWTRTLNRTRTAEPISWARVAAEGGYCDQSHMIEDYQRLVGATPATLFD